MADPIAEGLDAVRASRPDWWVYADVTALDIATTATGCKMSPGAFVRAFRRAKDARNDA